MDRLSTGAFGGGTLVGASRCPEGPKRTSDLQNHSSAIGGQSDEMLSMGALHFRFIAGKGKRTL